MPWSSSRSLQNTRSPHTTLLLPPNHTYLCSCHTMASVLIANVIVAVATQLCVSLPLFSTSKLLLFMMLYGACKWNLYYYYYCADLLNHAQHLWLWRMSTTTKGEYPTNIRKMVAKCCAFVLRRSCVATIRSMIWDMPQPTNILAVVGGTFTYDREDNLGPSSAPDVRAETGWIKPHWCVIQVQ